MTDAIDVREKANQPADMQDDGGRMTQHPLTHQIAADQYEAAKTGVGRAHRGLRYMKIAPAGTVS